MAFKQMTGVVMNIKKMELAWISVGDIARSKQFFTATLGLQIASSAEEHGWLELKSAEAGCMLGVGKDGDGNGPIRPGMNAVLTMTVDDVVTAKAELEGKGVQFVGDILEVPGHVKMVMFQDPDGNCFQLVQHLGDDCK